MKKLVYISGIIFSFLLISCEEDITLDFNETAPRLVIEGNIFTNEEIPMIKLSTTTDFYSNIVPKVEDAEVQIINMQTNEIYPFIHSGQGNYIASTIDFNEQDKYQLTVVYNNDTYTATSTLLPSPVVINVDQKDDGGFTGDSYEINFNFQDNADEENFYLVQIISPVDNAFGVINDQFSNGNIMNDLYFFDKEDIKPGDQLNHSITSISKQYYNYLSKIFSISGEASNPFASPIGTIKGNIVNQTNQENFALGYFHIAKRNHSIYIVK